MSDLKVKDLYDFMKEVKPDNDLFHNGQYVIPVHGYNSYDKHLRIDEGRSHLWIYVGAERFAVLHFIPETGVMISVDNRLHVDETGFDENITNIPFTDAWCKLGNAARAMLWDAVDDWLTSKR